MRTPDATPHLTRRDLLKGAGAAAATALAGTPAAAERRRFLETIADRIRPDKASLDALTHEIALRKWRDPILHKRLFTPRPELIPFATNH